MTRFYTEQEVTWSRAVAEHRPSGELASGAAPPYFLTAARTRRIIPVCLPPASDQPSRNPLSLRRSYRKAFPPAVRGEGVYLWDATGKRYLDFSGSAAVNFIGHGVREIPQAMIEQAAQLEFVHTSQFTTPVAEEYAKELLDFAGEHFRGGAVFFTCGGSEAVETALKLARQYQVEIGQDRRSGAEPFPELSWRDSGRTGCFRQQASPRHLPSDGARIRPRRDFPIAIAAPTVATIARGSMPTNWSARSPRKWPGRGLHL